MPESAGVLVARTVNWGGDKRAPLLLLFSSDGRVKALSLPTLRQLASTVQYSTLSNF